MSANNSSSDDSDYFEYYDTRIYYERSIGSIITSTLYTIIIFVGVLGNTLTIIVVASNRQMRNGTNLLIVNLASSDLLFLIFCVPFSAIQHGSGTWYFSHSWCPWMYYLQFVSVYGSSWTLVLLAVNRFVAIVFPLHSLTLCTTRNTILCIILLWTIVTLSNIFHLSIYGIFEDMMYLEKRYSCVFLQFIQQTASVTFVHSYYGSLVGLGYFTPLFIICILYVFILKNLWYSSTTVEHQSHVPRDVLRSKRKVTRMIAAVILTYSICLLPINLYFVFLAVIYKRNLTNLNPTVIYVVLITSQILAYANSCANPFLYALFSENFRNGFRLRFKQIRQSVTE